MNKQPAKRVFASEFNDATHRIRDESEQGAPSFLILPTGARAHRVWLCGTLTHAEDIGSGDEYWRAQITDFSGTFFAYGRPSIQTKGVRQLKQLRSPIRVAVVGKTHTYSPEYVDETYVSVEPEVIVPVSQQHIHRWGVETAAHTRQRIIDFDTETNEWAAQASEVYHPHSLDEYSALVDDALEHYNAPAIIPPESPSDQSPVSV